MKGNDLKITAMSFNIWGLPNLITSRLGSASIDKGSRMRGIGEALVSRIMTKDGSPLDVVCLQEAWRAKDRAILQEYGRRAGLTHSHYADLGIVGSGLMLLSRYPIESVETLPYALNGKPQRVHHGDWWAGKGVVYARLLVDADGGPVRLHVFNTHTHAAYSSSEYDGHRLLQLQQFGALVAATAPRFAATDLVLAMGDFNSFRQSPEFRLFLHMAGMRAVPMDTAEPTCGNGNQIDFVCYRPSSHWIAPDAGYVTFKGAADGNTHATVPFYSDHKAVVAAFVYSPRPLAATDAAPPSSLPDQLATDVHNLLEQAQQLTRARLRVHTRRSLLSFVAILAAAWLIWSVEHQSVVLPVVFAAASLFFFVMFVYSFFKFWELEKINECRRNLHYLQSSS